MIRKTSIFFLLVFIFSYSQIKKDNINPEIMRQLMLPHKTTEDGYKRGLELLKIAKSDDDFIRLYQYLGDIKDKQGKFLGAIKLFEKAAYYAEKSNDKEKLFFIYNHITLSYENVGQEDKAKQSWKKALSFVTDPNNDDINSYIYQYELRSLRNKKEFCKTDSIYKKLVKLGRNPKTDLPFLFAIYNGWAFDNIKCGNLSLAATNIDKADKIRESIKDDDKLYTLENYFLVKGIYNHIEKKEKANYYITKALETAKERKNFRILDRITENALLYNIKFDESVKKDSFLASLIENNERKLSEASKISSYELQKKDSIIVEKDSFLQNYVLLTLVVLFILIGGFWIFHIVNDKKVKTRFREIIEEIKSEKSIISEEKSDAVKKAKYAGPKVQESPSKIISEAKEFELYEKLKEFEKNSIAYTEKSFTISNLSTLLATNNRYISYIINKYYQQNFNDYINMLRINFIVNKMYNHPEYLSYKISYLSEVSGFSSHSRFAQNFKKILGITPSEFVHQFKKENDKQLKNN